MRLSKFESIKALKSIGSNFLNLLTNTQCIVCGNQSYGRRLCKHCIEFVNTPPSLASFKHHDLEIYYFGLYKDKLRDFILAYKFHNHDSLRSEFSYMLFKTIKTHSLKFDYITYIPATRSARKKRGYDHMYIISKELSKLANIRLINTLQAVRDTDQLLSQNREEAVRGKFEIINGVDLQNKTILLIDDVYTTGNTMREAIKTLRQANLLSIIPLVIAMNK